MDVSVDELAAGRMPRADSLAVGYAVQCRLRTRSSGDWRLRSAGAPDAARPPTSLASIHAPRRTTAHASVGRVAKDVAERHRDLEDRPGGDRGIARCLARPSAAPSASADPRSDPVSRPGSCRTENAHAWRVEELQRELDTRPPRGRPAAASPSRRDVEPVAVEPELDAASGPSAVGRSGASRPAVVTDLERPGAQPLEVARLLAVERRASAAPVGSRLRPAPAPPSRCC